MANKYTCFIAGCGNVLSTTSKLKFHRVPRGNRRFQVSRRRLWLKAIKQHNNTDNINGNSLICGAHFISGEASVDPNSPDFVPSIFPRDERTPNRKKKRKIENPVGTRWVGRRRKRPKTHVKKDIKDGSSLDRQSPEKQPSPSPSVPQEEEPLMKESNTKPEANATKSQMSPGVIKPSLSYEASSNVLNLETRFPLLCLRSVFTPEKGYKCDQCQEVFTNASQLVKHKQLHEEEDRLLVCEICGNIFSSQAEFAEHKHLDEPSFPCNMCDRSFGTTQCLKRHKLLHVKDGRKCGKCGVLFCQLHNHVLFLPQPTPEEGSPGTESLLESDPDSSSESDDQSSPPKPFPKVINPLPPYSHTRIMSEIPIPITITPPLYPQSSQSVPKYSRNHANISLPAFPPSLKIFSPQYLTSAFLEVNRNYEYIFSKPNENNEENIVKEEPCELPLSPSPCEQSIEFEKEINRIAYDVEIVL